MEDYAEALRRELGLQPRPSEAAPSPLPRLESAFPDAHFEEHDDELCQLVLAVDGPTRLGELNVDALRGAGFDANVGDEFLFPLYDRATWPELGEGLVDAADLLRVPQADPWEEAARFVERLRVVAPRPVLRRRFPYPLPADTFGHPAAGWAGVIAGRSVTPAVDLERGFVAPEVDDVARVGARLEAVREQTGLPMGVIQTGLGQPWLVGCHLAGWSMGEALGPLHPTGWREVLESVRALDTSVWTELLDLLAPGHPLRWNEPQPELLFGGRAHLVDGRAEVVPRPFSADWPDFFARPGFLLRCAFDGRPKPIGVRGRVIEHVDGVTPLVAELLDDPGLRLWVVPDAIETGCQSEGRRTALHADTHAAPVPTTEVVPLPPRLEAVAERLGAARKPRGFLRKRIPLTTRLEDYESLRLFLQPREAFLFRAPADAASLERLEALGPPPALLELYRWHDGQSDKLDGGEGLFDGWRFLPIAEALDTLASLREIRGDDFHPRWLPFACNGGGDVLIVDLRRFGRARTAMWNHESDNLDLEFEDTVEGLLQLEFDSLLHSVRNQRRLAWCPQRELPQLETVDVHTLRWTDMDRVPAGGVLVATAENGCRVAMRTSAEGPSPWLEIHADSPDEAWGDLRRRVLERSVDRLQFQGGDTIARALLHDAVPFRFGVAELERASGHWR